MATAHTKCFVEEGEKSSTVDGGNALADNIKYKHIRGAPK